MTYEAFKTIGVIARDMVREIEWADFPLRGEIATTASRELFAACLADPSFLDAVRHQLDTMLVLLKTEYPALPDHQEPEQQGAGLVQAALKAALIRSHPPLDGLAELNRELLRTKFKRLETPVMQAPHGVLHVPSMAEQGYRSPPPDRPLEIFVIYRNPSDYPGKFVVRRHLCTDPTTVDAAPLAVVDSLRDAREAIPRGLFCIGREPNDDPVIAERWL